MILDECNNARSAKGRMVCEDESCGVFSSLFNSEDEAEGERGSVEGKMSACIHRMSNVIRTTVNISC